MSNIRRVYTYEEFIKYRNKMIQRRDARHRTFPSDTRLSYYDIRINEINELYPEYSKIGKITLKKDKD